MDHSVPALLGSLLVVVALVAAGGVAAADDELTVSSLEVSPSDPVPGEVVTFTPTVSASGRTVTIDGVRVTNQAGTVVASASNLYSISGGEQVEVPVSGRLPDGETHNLRIVVEGTTSAGESVTATETVSIEVDGVAPNVAVESDEPMADAESGLSMSVANTLGVEMRNVKLRLSAPGFEVRGSGFDASVPAGEHTTFNYTVVAEEAGRLDVNATLVFDTDDDGRRRIVTTVPVVVEPLDDAVTVSASARRGSVRAAVANHGDATVEDVEVTARSGGRLVDRTLVDEVGPHGTRNVSLDASGLSGDANVTVRAAYAVGTRNGSVETTVEVLDRPGQVRLTGVNVVEEGGKLRISGSASNVGLTQVNGTIVSVVATDQVTPAQPNRDYFVGPVPANDFVSFDLYATVDGNVSSIPVRVEYLVEGEAVDRVVEVPVGDVRTGVGASGPPGNPGGTRQSGLPVVPAVAVVLVVAAGLFLWRRRG